MTHREALEILAACRGEHVVITTHGSIDLWTSLSDTALDFSYVPIAMGQGPLLGLGLALSQSRRGVVVVTGDGSILMNMGCLVTLAAHPANLFVIIIDNGVYEVTGGQPTVGTGQVDFAGVARAAGIQRVYAFGSAASWREMAAEALAGAGPVVIWLKVLPRPGEKPPMRARPIQEQIARLENVLQGFQGS